jgi:hypothetical protein
MHSGLQSRSRCQVIVIGAGRQERRLDKSSFSSKIDRLQFGPFAQCVGPRLMQDCYRKMIQCVKEKGSGMPLPRR